MKNIFRLFVVAATMIAIVAAVGCSKESDEPTEPQPTVNSVVIDFEGAAWSALNATTAGKCYSAEIMTEDYAFASNPATLSSKPEYATESGYTYYAAGFTLSSYNTADAATYGSYEYDLYLYNPASRNPTQGGGHNGSNNFMVAYGTVGSLVPEAPLGQPILYFADGVERTIKSCYVASTSYFVNVARNGNSFAEPLGEGDVVKIYATGFDKSGRQTGVVEKVFARKGNLTEQWSKWDLSALGAVVKVNFDVLGGPETPYGMTTPKYFAIDDISIEWEQK
jgi:hypothetical protein